MEIPLIISKAWLCHRFGRCFRYIRNHLLTDEVITEELNFDLDDFRRWKDFPPAESIVLKDWLTKNRYLPED